MADTTVTKIAEPVSSAAMRRQMLREFWFYFSENRGAVLGLIIFVALVIVAIFASFIAPHSPFEQYRDFALLPRPGPRAATRPICSAPILSAATSCPA